MINLFIFTIGALYISIFTGVYVDLNLNNRTEFHTISAYHNRIDMWTKKHPIKTFTLKYTKPTYDGYYISKAGFQEWSSAMMNERDVKLSFKKSDLYRYGERY